MEVPFAAELAAARQAASLAGHAIMELYASFLAIAEAPADISTEADGRAQEIILHHLTAAFPDDAFCAEEDSATLRSMCRSGPRLWIIDPIDGSRGFAKKLGEFSVMIGLVVDGVPQVGVVSEPARERSTWAVRGQGCWKANGRSADERCRVSEVQTWNEAALVRSHSEKNAEKPVVNAVKRQLFTYSAGIKLALVARGEADVYLSTYRGFNSWDVCAGHLLVEEAGGRISDLAGHTVRYQQDGADKIPGTIATNSALHELAIRLLNS